MASGSIRLLYSLCVVLVAVVCLLFYNRQAHVGQATLRGNTDETRQDKTRQRQKTKTVRHGYALSLDYSDQMTGSSMNLLSLQCWAQQSGMVVVEPFFLRSVLGVSLGVGKNCTQPNAVRLSDVFDIDVWQRFSRDKGYSPLVSWEEFLSSAPRDVIIVSQPGGSECRKSEFRNSVSPLSSEYGFRIVREVCFRFQDNVETSGIYYSTNLFGEYSSTNITVLFDRWGGIQRNKDDIIRTVISDSSCGRNGEDVTFAATSSKHISSDVEQYVYTYLSGSTKYITVMIRFENYFSHHHLRSKNQDEQSVAIDSCLRSILHERKELKNKFSLNSTLLTMDYGKHGSGGFVFGDVSWEEKMRSFFSDIFGTSLTVSQWEDSFEAIARKKSPGYIAQMQRELAARGQCLLLAGSAGASSFQQQAKALYQQYHSGSAECISTACT